jgi:hypothetical protein
MSTATTTAILGTFQGSSISNAFKDAGSQAASTPSLDLFQIVIPGDNPTDNPTVVVNVDSTGSVHNPASKPTVGTRLGVFQSTAASGSTTALFFSTAFANPALLDIIQCINLGGNISYNCNYLGVTAGT